MEAVKEEGTGQVEVGGAGNGPTQARPGTSSQESPSRAGRRARLAPHALPGSSGGWGGAGTVRTGEADGQGLSGPTRGELNPSCTLTGGGSEFGTIIYWFSLNYCSSHLYNGGNGD